MGNNEEINKNYELLFEKPEEESKKIHAQINMLMNEQPDMEKLKQTLRVKYGDEFFEYTYLNDLINYFTSIEHQDMRQEILREFKLLSIVDDMYTVGEDTYVIKTKKGIVSFTTINRLLMSKSEETLKIDDVKKYDLSVSRYSNRSTRCHELSIDAAKILLKYLEIKNKVVTGYPSYYVEKIKGMHSWIEMERNEQIYVIDSTMNVIMNKEGYFLLRHINEQEIISIISAEDIMEDYRVYGGFLNELDLKTYLTARNEIIRDLERNKHLFNKSDGDER